MQSTVRQGQILQALFSAPWPQISITRPWQIEIYRSMELKICRERDQRPGFGGRGRRACACAGWKSGLGTPDTVHYSPLWSTESAEEVNSWMAARESRVKEWIYWRGSWHAIEGKKRVAKHGGLKRKVVERHTRNSRRPSSNGACFQQGLEKAKRPPGRWLIAGIEVLGEERGWCYHGMSLHTPDDRSLYACCRVSWQDAWYFGGRAICANGQKGRGPTAVSCKACLRAWIAGTEPLPGHWVSWK